MGNFSSSTTLSDHNYDSYEEQTIQEEFSRGVELECLQHLMLDESRRQFVCEQAVTTYQLLTGRLVNSSRFRRCLLGRKSIGKTMLLKSLCTTLKIKCKELQAKNKCDLIILFLSCDMETSQTPRSMIAMSLKLSPNAPWSDVETKLKCCNKRILLVIDELQLVFNQTLFCQGIDFIKDITCIGGDMNGLYHCILSGSSSNLRRLVSGKLSMDEAKVLNLMNYAKVDLNDTKFQSYTITPFLKENDLLALVNYLARKYHKKNSYNLDKVFMDTAGFPGVLDEYIRNNTNVRLDQYDIGLRLLDRDSEKFKILSRLFKVVKELKSMHTTVTTPTGATISDNADNNYFDDSHSVEFTWTTLVSVDHVDANIQPAVLYEMADLGYLQYQDNEAIQSIGFYSPRIYLEMLLCSSRDGLTLAELMALRCPHGMYEKSAENVTASILMLAEQLWKDEIGVSGRLFVAFLCVCSVVSFIEL